MKQKTRRWLIIAMIGALYTALSLALAPYSFGPVQVRIAEAMTLLPLLSPLAIGGLTLGCAVTNLIGAATGLNILGYYDVVWGTLATFSAALITYHFRTITIKKIPVLSVMAPIVLNALIIGAELTVAFGPPSWIGFGFYALSVGAGQAISVIVLGLPLLKAVESTKLFNKNPG
jgi:uncharacterized membrane protein